MVKVIFHTLDGKRIEAEEPVGSSAMRAAVNANVPGIDADCGGACSCATCHVQVVDQWMALVGPASSTETDMIEFDGEVTPTSRLSCQSSLAPELDGLELRITPRG